MFKKKKYCKIMGFILVFALAFSTTALAKTSEGIAMTTDPQQALADAKEYLMTYSIVGINEFGKEYTTKYIFKTNQDLDSAAEYIVEYGLDGFNKAVETAVEEVVSQERQSELILPNTTDPVSTNKTISGDGTHTVSAQPYGLASFETLGSVEYLPVLSYRVTVKDGKITNLNYISFDIPHIGAGGSWGELSLPSYFNDTNAGVTANFTITKTVTIPIGNFEFDIKSETDREFFGLLTTLK